MIEEELLCVDQGPEDVLVGLLFGFGAFLFFLHGGKFLVEVPGSDGEFFSLWWSCKGA